MISIDEQEWLQLPGYRKNVLLADEDLHCPGTRVQLVTIEPGDTISNHHHKTSFEVYYVLQGVCQLFVNDEKALLQTGSVLVMEPGDVHQLHNHGLQKFVLLVFKTNAGKADTYWST